MTPLRFVALVVCSALATIAFVGCAPTSAYVNARQIETGAAKFVDTAGDTWHAYSHAQLENYKQSCKDMDCFNQLASQWESGTVAPADKAIVTAREAVRTFDKSLNAADAVKAKDFSAAIQDLISAVTSMASILNGYGLSLALFKVL